jgi:hypothetical protein
VPGFPVGEDRRTQDFVAQFTHTFSPSVVNIARLAFLRNKFLFDQHLNNTSPASLAFEYQPTLGIAAGPPFIQFGGGGYASICDPITGPRNTYENAIAAAESLTWVRGRHELKFGADYRRDQINVINGIASNGFFVFIPAPLSNALANFLIGQPYLFLQGGGDLPGGGGDLSRGLRGNDFNFYGQDTYKINSNLTLNLGLRYDLPSPYTEIRNRQNLFLLDEPLAKAVEHRFDAGAVADTVSLLLEDRQIPFHGGRRELGRNKLPTMSWKLRYPCCELAQDPQVGIHRRFVFLRETVLLVAKNPCGRAYLAWGKGTT